MTDKLRIVYDGLPERELEDDLTVMLKFFGWSWCKSGWDAEANLSDLHFERENGDETQAD